jgi:hypothetical protein
MRTVIAVCFLAVLFALGGCQKKTQPVPQPTPQPEFKWLPLELKPQAWPDKVYNGQSVSGEKFVYFQESQEQRRKTGISARLTILSGEKFPAAGSAELKRLQASLLEAVNKDTSVKSLVSITSVSQGREAITVEYGFANSYFPIDRMQKPLNSFFRATLVNLTFMDLTRAVYWSGPWKVEFDPKKSPRSQYEQRWNIISALPTRAGVEARISEGRNDEGQENLLIDSSFYDSSESDPRMTPVQTIVIWFKDGHPKLKEVRWHTTGDRGGSRPWFNAPVHDWFGKNFARYIGDLPPEVRRYLTPEIMEQINAAAPAVRKQQLESSEDVR